MLCLFLTVTRAADVLAHIRSVCIRAKDEHSGVPLARSLTTSGGGEVTFPDLVGIPLYSVVGSGTLHSVSDQYRGTV